jgi:hypothetical protein
MNFRRRGFAARVSLIGLLILLVPGSAIAGMPNVTLTDIAQMRVQTMSFFLFLLLVSALVVMLIWNGLRRDFVKLPRLTYLKSLGVVSLWGLLFILVLTMISGARELMTPGAWERSGATYRLSGADDRQTLKQVEQTRRARLEALREALWAYAREHDGALPPDDRVAEIPPRLWEAPDPSRARYLYTPGRRVGVGSDPVAIEPPIFGSAALVLRSDGQIR